MDSLDWSWWQTRVTPAATQKKRKRCWNTVQSETKIYRSSESLYSDCHNDIDKRLGMKWGKLVLSGIELWRVFASHLHRWRDPSAKSQRGEQLVTTMKHDSNKGSIIHDQCQRTTRTSTANLGDLSIPPSRICWLNEFLRTHFNT